MITFWGTVWSVTVIIFGCIIQTAFLASTLSLAYWKNKCNYSCATFQWPYDKRVAAPLAPKRNVFLKNDINNFCNHRNYDQTGHSFVVWPLECRTTVLPTLRKRRITSLHRYVVEWSFLFFVTEVVYSLFCTLSPYWCHRLRGTRCSLLDVYSQEHGLTVLLN